jgi:hypothetical protein
MMRENRKLADEEEWRFELGYLDPTQPDKPTHVLAGIWEQPPGYLYWTMHEISEGKGLVDAEDKP